jgi:hypothetical protein
MNTRILRCLLAVIVAGPLGATSARTVNPVAGVKTIKIEVALGGPMSLDSRSTTDLWGSQLRADGFKRRLENAIAKRFGQSAITVDPTAKHTMMFGIWGRPLSGTACEDTSVAFIEGSFHDETKLDQPDYAGQSNSTWGRSIIEVAPDVALEEALEKAVLELVAEVLHRGTGKDD